VSTSPRVAGLNATSWAEGTALRDASCPGNVVQPVTLFVPRPGPPPLNATTTRTTPKSREQQLNANSVLFAAAQRKLDNTRKSPPDTVVVSGRHVQKPLNARQLYEKEAKKRRAFFPIRICEMNFLSKFERDLLKNETWYSTICSCQGWEVQGISIMQTLHLEPILYFFNERTLNLEPIIFFLEVRTLNLEPIVFFLNGQTLNLGPFAA
jgi:hypothetical protein